MFRGLVGAAFGLLLASAPAAAQARPYQSPEPAVSFRVAGMVSFEHFLASRSFAGVLGSANGVTYGGGAEVVWRHIFFRGDVSRFTKTGQLAFDYNGQIFQLGTPEKISVTPVVGTVGYRALVGRRMAVYAGGGVGSWSYSQTTNDAADTVSIRKTGFEGLAGVEWRLARWIGVAGEATFASVPNALGQSGSISGDFGEKNLGGTSGTVRIVIGR